MKRLLVIGSLALAALVWCPKDASAQDCTYNGGGNGISMSGSPAYDIYADASTGSGNPGCGSRVEVWIDGVSWKECSVGSFEGGACVRQTSWGNVWAVQHAAITTYGTWWGEYNSYLINNNTGQWFFIAAGGASIYLGPPSGDNCSGDSNPDDPNCQYSPIIIPLGQGNSFRHVGTVLFDINGDGALDVIPSYDDDVAFLAIDRNGNGVIDNGTELFGNYTLAGSPNGFDALDKIMAHDVDGDIDAADPLFAHLLLWVDANHDGVSQPEELKPFGSRFGRIGLGYEGSQRKDGQGTEYRFKGWVQEREEISKGPKGRYRPAYDVFFAR